MNLAKALFEILTTDATIGPQLLADGIYKVHPLTGYLTEEPPFITTQEITTIPSNNKNQPSTVDAIAVQVNIIHHTYDDAKQLAAEVRQCLDYNAGTYGGVNIQHITFTTTTDTYSDAQQLTGGVMIQQQYSIRVQR